MTPSLQNLRIQPLLGAQPLGAHASPRKPWSCAPLALLALSLTLGMPSASLEAKKSESINEPNVWSRLGVWGVISGPWNQSEILQETIQNKESPSETPKTMQDLQANQMKGLINRLVDPSTHSNSIKNLQVLVDAGVSDYDAIQLLLQWTMPNEKLIEAMIKTKPGANLIADATPKIMAPANKTSDDLANIIRKNLDPFFTNQNAKNFALPRK